LRAKDIKITSDVFNFIQASNQQTKVAMYKALNLRSIWENIKENWPA
jgi:hypothetical protein